ncbi:hypothetical protein L2E82_37567 [Cichorium intybus]|uniref:Uncharacterized protein n=1 Tax=Cichorium intybus TaxID=13427 RepID=A0ACB9AFA5_CICIN|nr:hypothetical protein L2E82_37567 [Cichorium intybus]
MREIPIHESPLCTPAHDVLLHSSCAAVQRNTPLRLQSLNRLVKLFVIPSILRFNKGLAFFPNRRESSIRNKESQLLEFVIMSGLQTQDFSSTLRLTKAPKDQGPTAMAESESKPKKKICCACPDTKKLRDECVVEHGESACSKWIEAHRLCLRSEGFNV